MYINYFRLVVKKQTPAHQPEVVKHVFCLPKVDLVQRLPHLVFHVLGGGGVATGSGDCHMTYLHHPANVGDVGAGIRHGMVRLCLSGERASKIDGPGVRLDGLQP